MLKGNLTISRPSGGRHDDNPCISITIRDAGSRIDFANIELPLAAFAEALTGLSEVECDLTVRDLANVGKVREFERICLTLSKAYLDEKGVTPYGRELEQFLATDPDGILAPHKKNGWTINTSLRSQGSVTSHNSGFDYRINLGRYRYMDAQSTSETP